MVRLEHGDFEAVFNAVRAVAATRDPDEFSRIVIAQVAELIPADVVTINEVDPEAGRTVYLAETASFPVPPDGDAVLAELADQHPIIHLFMSTGDGSAYRISDFWSRSESRPLSVFPDSRKSDGVLGAFSVPTQRNWPSLSW